MAIRDRLTAHMRSGLNASYSVEATRQGGSVELREPKGRDPFYQLVELNSVGDAVRIFHVHKDEISAIVQDQAPR